MVREKRVLHSLGRWCLVACVLLVILTGCGGGGREVESAVEEPQPTVPPPTIPPLAAGSTVAADGRLVSPYPQLPLGFGGGVSGQVLTVTVRAGDVVSAGELLALLDESELQRSVDDAQRALERATADRDRAQQQWERDRADAQDSLAAAQRALESARLRYSDTAVEEARTALERAQQAEADAQDTYEKVQTMWPPVPIEGYLAAWQRATRERELAEMRLADAQDAHSADYLALAAYEEDVARAERALAALEEGLAPSYERAVEDAEVQLAQAEEALTHARLIAPWAAIVLSVDVAPAAVVGSGTPIVTLLDIEEGLRFVTLDLSEQHVAGIRPGQRAVVTLRAFPDTPLEGSVEAVVPQVGEETGEGAVFAVRIRLAPADVALLPGLTGRVEIWTGD